MSSAPAPPPPSWRPPSGRPVRREEEPDEVDWWVALVVVVVNIALAVGVCLYLWRSGTDGSAGRALVMGALPFALPLAYALFAIVYAVITGHQPLRRPWGDRRWGLVFIVLFALAVFGSPYVYLHGFVLPTPEIIRSWPL